MSEAVIAVALVWVTVSGTAVVLTRDPLRQAFVAGFFGLGLAFLYLSLQAGDVALVTDRGGRHRVAADRPA